ncbi:hypothetical protein DFH08DRAFT_1039403 [Mycena albidolilacea]|uniref:Uncharacterized protein n=1 Tax=Mycena albidolilacea TaxID=1033008 RepID=A0AAD6ZD08_9AGAR|nr:hypothetical protein DFH08DRAFT_1039403 [Mycena albidolilacea]
MPRPSIPAHCSLGKASMTSSHSSCPPAPVQTMNAARLRDDQTQFHSYRPGFPLTFVPAECKNLLAMCSSCPRFLYALGSDVHCTTTLREDILRVSHLRRSHSKSSTNDEFQRTASALTSTRSRVSSCSPDITPAGYSGMRALCILDTGHALRMLIHPLRLAAHDPHPSVTLKLGFAGCCWDLETRGTMDDMRAGVARAVYSGAY